MMEALKRLAMRDLRLWLKVAVSSFLFVLAALYAIWVVFGLTTPQIETARRERLGLQLHGELRRMQNDLQIFNGSVNVGQAAASEIIDWRNSSRAGVQAAATRIDAFHQRTGDPFGSLAAWQRAQSASQALLALPRDAPADLMRTTQDTAVRALIALMEQITVDANLILDPELDSYVILDAMMTREPRATAEADLLRTYGLQLLEGVGSADARSRMLELLVLSRERSESVRRSLASASKLSHKIAGLFEADLQRDQAVSDEFFKAAESIRRDAAKSGFAGSDYFTLGMTFTEGRYRLYQAGAKAADHVLQQRIAAFEVQRATTLGAVSLALLLSAALLFVILQDIGRRLAVATTAAANLAQGRLEDNVYATGKDEIGDLMRSLALTGAQLRAFSDAELEVMQQHQRGHTGHRIAVAAFPGAYGDIAGKLNQLVDEHVAEQARIIDTVQSYVKGDFARQPPELPGDKAAITRALTDVRQLQMSLRELQQRYEALFRMSPTPSALVTTKERRWSDVNQALVDLLGYSREQLIGRTGSELGLVRNPDVGRALGARLAAEGRVRDFEADFVTADGTARTVIAYVEPVHWQGEPVLLFQYVDISARKRAEDALRASEQRFAAMFHDAPTPLTLNDALDGRFLDVNPAWLSLFGFTREQVVGHTSQEFNLYIDPSERDKIYGPLARDGFVERAQLEMRRHDGSVCLCLMSGRIIEADGRRMMVSALSDVTGERQAQRQIELLNESLELTVAKRTRELTQANAELQSALDNLKTSQDALLRSERLAALGRLVAGVAHELNTPIGNALLTASTVDEHTESFAQAAQAGLRRSALDSYLASSRHASQIMLRNLEKAAELIRSFKQVAADQSSSQRRDFALKDVVDEVLLAHHPMLKKTTVVVNTDVPADITLDSYPGPLGQVLGNLLSNAVLHGFDGRAEGRIHIRASMARHDGVQIEVSDDGNGIPAENVQRVFDPFFTTRMGRGGTGLGLSICHRIVSESLGGSISLSSRAGQGCTFTLTLPLSVPVVDEGEAA